MHLDELVMENAQIIQAIADDIAEGISFKITKNGGLTRCRQQRDICQAAGYTFTVQDNVGAIIAFAATVHFAQSVAEQNRCVLGVHHMVTVTTADGPFDIIDGKIRAPDVPGLGVEPRMDVLGQPVASCS